MINAVPLLAAAGGEYEISRSVRLRSSASAYFNRTFGTPTSGNIFTWSGWVKRGAIGAVQPLFNPSLAAGEGAVFNASNQISIAVNGALLLVSSAVYRDPSAWYHIVLVSDMGNATASLRFRVYVNGVEVTAWGTDARASYSSFPYWNKNTVVHYMGYSNAYPAYADGYMTEVNFIDGQALTPSSFGETDAVTSVWKPKKYTGTYGTNGFYLNFSDNSNNTAATIGKDYSGNGNNWTPNNISVTSGVTYDSMLDVPTPYADGGNGRGNYSVLNPLMLAGAGVDVAQGNQYANRNSAGWARIASSFGVTSGKWYWEILPNNSTTSQMIGVGLGNTSSNYPGYESNTYGFYTSTGQKYNNNTGASYGSYTVGQLVGVALDLDNGKIWFSCNGTWQASGDPAAGTNAAFTGISGTYFPEYGLNGSSTNGYANFGQRPFSYTPPSGFVALNTQNLPAGTITTSGSFTGNASTDGPFVYLNGVPTAMTINGNAVTFGTHADKTANGFKVRSSSSSYNASGSNTYSITTTGAKFKYANAQGNP